MRNHPIQRLTIKCLTIIQIELEFGNLGFRGEGKTGVPGEKPFGAEYRTKNKLNPHMTPGLGIEPGTHWWEVSALNTAQALLPLLTIVIVSYELLPSRCVRNFNLRLVHFAFLQWFG